MSDVPFEVQKLDHLVLRTKGIERLRSFYELLGLTIVRDLRPKMSMLQLRLGQSMLDLVEVDEERIGRNLDHYAVRVEPFDQEAIVAFCQSHGIDVQIPPVPLLGAEGVGPAVYIQDPDGNRLELKGPVDKLS